jgi:hypothetical protein
MYVSELLEYLKTMPQNAKVVIEGMDGVITGTTFPNMGIVDKKTQTFLAPQNYKDGETIVFI